MKKFAGFFLFFLITLNQNFYSQNNRILLDEIYTDWENSTGIDDLGDVTTGKDFTLLKVENYDNYLFILLEMDFELNLQSDNEITLYIDTDNNSTTGYAVNGIGAEIEYTFGNRSGKFYYDNISTYISHEDIGLITLPTVTSTIFEIQLNLDAIIVGKTVFTDSTLHIIIKNNISDGDLIPNNIGGFEYTLTNSEPQIEIFYSINKLDDNHLRIMSYNIERDQLFETSNKKAHRRIFQAVKPDIIGFQEIYNHTAQQTADLIEEFLPTTDNTNWYSSDAGSDVIVVSRFPIKQSFAIDGNAAFLIDLNEKYQREFLFVNAHTPCCSNNDGRQQEIDHFMAFIRDAKKEGGVLTIAEGTPIVIVGDMNLVGLKQQQTTLITGNIVNQNLYGEAFMPDWDSTYLQDTKPIATNMPSTFTWYDEGSSYSPGRLDYVIFTNSVMTTKNNYVLFTEALPQDSLILYNLESSDVTSVADHLPVIVDFELSPNVSVNDERTNLNYDFSLEQNYPNPFNPSTTIKYTLSADKAGIPTAIGTSHDLSQQNVQLIVYDILGREVATLVNKEQAPGNYEVTFDANNLSSGIYYYKLQTGSFVKTLKMILLK